MKHTRSVWPLALVLTVAWAGCESPPPTTGSLISVNGTHLFVRELGAGDPLVVVHGGPLLSHQYLKSGLDPLSDQFRLIYYDQRISGRSAGRSEPATIRLATWVDDLDSLRASLGLESMHLMGHSWGGFVASHYAFEHPERVRSLTLVGTLPETSDAWREEEQALALRADSAWAVLMDSLRRAPGLQTGEPSAIADLMRGSFRIQYADPERAAELDLFVPTDRIERGQLLDGMMADLMQYDLVERYGSLGIPTLLVYGADEPLAAASASRLASIIPGAELQLIDDAGHFPMLEQPEAFREATSAFLSRGAR